ncbi:MAG: signal peptidase I [Verrucomicrobiales bacterium]|jgi:signal peptidase I|nr:signal peptidase I [Verrucomicrobiales bacterium]
MSIKKEARDFLQFLHKKWNYSRDLLGPRELERVAALRGELRQAAEGGLPEGEARRLFEQTPQRLEKIWPGCTKSNPWVENIETIFTVLVIVLGLRCYFVQPFKIPTDSMKPTLWGIYREPTEVAKPNVVRQILDYAVSGRSYHALTAPADGHVERIRPGRSFLFVGTSKVQFAGREYTLWTDYENLVRSLAIKYGIPQNQPLSSLSAQITTRLAGKGFRRGETIANFTVDAGDHVFVNKLAYHFRLPKQGGVFVFTTKDIRHPELLKSTQGMTQYYIKRCVGVPGVTLRLNPPYLYSNGEIFHNAAVDRIYSKQNGYNGYVSGGYLATADDEVRLPANQFWAMGDNSANSLDSRYWKYVPRENLVGSATMVYWPFTKRWGLIK